MIDLRDADDRLAAAGEYVLGTLDAADRAVVEGALATDRALLAEVYAWQDRLLGLSAQVAPAEPAPALWQRIAGTLDARADNPPRNTLPRPRWYQRAAPWQAASGFAFAALTALAIFFAGAGRAPEAGGARYLALLQSPEDHATGWIVEIEAGRDLRLVPVAPGAAVPAGRSLQFWTKPQGAAAPTSLGRVLAGTALVLPVSRLPSVGEQQLFEITLEPEGGSPIGRPTGPILFVGRTLHL